MADNDMISRSALFEDITGAFNRHYEKSYYQCIHDFFNCTVRRINNAPAVDAVEVVRCKECRHCDPENHHCDHSVGTMIYFPRKPDDFCSYGEKRSVEHD